MDRTVPVVSEVGNVRRLLDPSISLSDGALLRTYPSPSGKTDRKLAEHLEQADLSNYRRVLRRLHTGRQIKYAKATGQVEISPAGIREVDDRLLKSSEPL